MSAYVVSDEHLNYLVSFLLTKRNGEGMVYLKSKKLWLEPANNIELILNVLFNENVRSVNYRYKDRAQYSRGPFRLITGPFDPIQVLKACHCLAYQSNETEDWESTDAYQILQGIERAAIYQLPGYNDALWGYSSTFTKAVR